MMDAAADRSGRTDGLRENRPDEGLPALPPFPPALRERNVELRAERLTRRFGLRTIFSDLSFTLGSGDILAITGRNGSGKSTLLKILANAAEHSSGSVRWSLEGNALDAERLPAQLGYVAPYLQLYGEFAAWEHVELLQEMRGLSFDPERASLLFELFGLGSRRNEPIETYSSGMMQRVKFICALIHHPSLLFLDEPMSNLDVQGIATMRALIGHESAGRITIIATNEEEDVELCTKMLSVERKGRMTS